MRFAALGVSILTIGVAAVAIAATAPKGEPFWAWGFTNLDGEKKAQKEPVANAAVHNGNFTLTKAQHDALVAAGLGDPVVQNGSLTVTRAQHIELAKVGPVDWYPEDHQGITTPDIVAFGSKTPRPNLMDSNKPVTITACSLCHLPNGFGRTENANVAGLPVEYFKEQINEFKTGKRNTSDPNKTNEAQMIAFAQVLTDKEVQDAAEYFAKFTYVTTPKLPNWIMVQEVDRVPKFGGDGSWMIFTDKNNYTPNGVVFVKDTGDNFEPIGNRIVETPRIPADQDAWRDPHSGFMAYVPVGSLEKGKKLVETGDGRFMACTGCHGAQLQGNGTMIPPLAGRSPGYIARQLFDMGTGKRDGTWTQVMATVVSELKPDDILNISAYIASMQPSPPVVSTVASAASLSASPPKVQ